MPSLPTASLIAGSLILSSGHDPKAAGRYLKKAALLAPDDGHLLKEAGAASIDSMMSSIDSMMSGDVKSM